MDEVLSLIKQYRLGRVLCRYFAFISYHFTGRVREILWSKKYEKLEEYIEASIQPFTIRLMRVIANLPFLILSAVLTYIILDAIRELLYHSGSIWDGIVEFILTILLHILAIPVTVGFGASFLWFVYNLCDLIHPRWFFKKTMY